MKKVISLLSLLLALVIAENSEAALYDRGTGMIYDDVLKITWLQNANYALTSGYDSDGKMTWGEAMNWADQLNYGGYTDWRLPNTPFESFDMDTMARQALDIKLHRVKWGIYITRI